MRSDVPSLTLAVTPSIYAKPKITGNKQVLESNSGFLSGGIELRYQQKISSRLNGNLNIGAHHILNRVNLHTAEAGYTELFLLPDYFGGYLGAGLSYTLQPIKKLVVLPGFTIGLYSGKTFGYSAGYNGADTTGQSEISFSLNQAEDHFTAIQISCHIAVQYPMGKKVALYLCPGYRWLDKTFEPADYSARNKAHTESGKIWINPNRFSIDMGITFSLINNYLRLG